MKVVIVGAGMIGVSIAWQLAHRGAEVIVVDGGLPAATSASFGWINASFYHDEAHHRLRVASMAAYRRMMVARPDLPICMCGALWWEEQGAALHDMKAKLQALEYRVEHLSHAQAQRMEPDLTGLPQDLLQFPSEGAAEAGALAVALIRASGARVVSGVRVTGIAVERGAVCGVETQIGRIGADRVVIAAGNGAPEILNSVGVDLPMLVRPGVMVKTKPVKARISQILVTPHGEVRQLPDGRLMASAVANHQGDTATEVTEQAEVIAARLLGWLDPMIANETLGWDQVMLAYRPVPADGLPVIGQAGPAGLHIAVMHSGVTLAAFVGEAVAREVDGEASNSDIELLASYRPDRFQ